MKKESTLSTITRRKLISSLGIIAGGTTLLGLNACSTKEDKLESKRIPFDPSDYKQSTKAFLKIAGSLGTELTRKWFTGKVHAYFPGKPVVPLFYLDGFYLTQYEALENGTHKATRFEITIKRDIETGELLENWYNPFTNRTEPVSNTVGGPQYKLYNDWGFDKPEKPRGPENPLKLEWTTVGDYAWCTWDLYLRFKNPLQPDKFPLKSSGEMLNLVNLTNYKGSLSDIENPDILNAPGELIWNGVSGWLPWMRMGQIPGTLIYKTIGVKIDNFKNDIPEQIYNAAEKAFPGHLSEQKPWQEGGYEWFDKKFTDN